MAVKDEELEHFYGVDQMNRAFEDSVGRVNAMKLGFTPKRPDAGKVKTLMEKAKRPTGPAQATFFLSLNGDKLTFEVRVATTRIVLNTLDLATVKDMAKRRHLMWSISQRTHLIEDKDLAEFDKTQADPEDQGEAVEINKQIDRLKNGIDNLQSMLNAANYKNTKYNPWDGDFRKWCEEKRYARYIDFVDDVENGRGLGKGAALLENESTSGIKPATLAAIQAARDKNEKPDYSKAKLEVLQSKVNSLLLPMYNKEKIESTKKEIAKMITEASDLKKKLQQLKAN